MLIGDLIRHHSKAVSSGEVIGLIRGRSRARANHNRGVSADLSNVVQIQEISHLTRGPYTGLKCRLCT